jgi:DNA-binding NarL/FixJ family response regulator
VSTHAAKSGQAAFAPGTTPEPAVQTCPLRADEVAVLALLAEGLPLDTVARQLAVSERTLRRRTRAICDLLGVPAAITAVAWAARRGLL